MRRRRGREEGGKENIYIVDSGAYIMNILMEIITKFHDPVSFVIREVSEVKRTSFLIYLKID